MLSVQEIQSRISGLRMLGDDPEKIMEAIENIFYELISEDSQLFAIFNEVDESPYFAPSNQSKNELFMRLFTHKHFADKVVVGLKDQIVKTITPIEIIQLAASAFPKGAFGYILNEGDKWLVFPFPLCLKVFATRVMMEGEMYRQECADIINFVHAVRKNGISKYAALYVDGAWGSPDYGPAYIIQDHEKVVVPQIGESRELKPISVQSLYRVPTNAVRIISKQKEFEVERGLLVEALRRCGIRMESQYKAPDSYISDPPLELCWEEDWRAKEISLSFGPSMDEEANIPPEESTADTKASPPRWSTKEKIAKFAAVFGNTLSVIRTKAQDVRSAVRQIFGELPDLPNEKHPTEAAPEAADLETRESVGKIICSGKKSMNLIPIFAVLVVLLAGIVGTLHYRHQQKFSQFCEYLDARDFGSAYVLYQEIDFHSAGQSYLENTIDNLVIAYAKNRISVDELKASLQALANFSGIQQSLEMANLTVCKLEDSKSAYVKGLNSDSTYGRLELWQQVIPLDDDNYHAVLNAIDVEREENIKTLDKEIQYYSTRSREFANDRYDVLRYWYPESALLEKWEEEFESDGPLTLAFYPITIKEVKINQETNGYWTLYINWENISAKQIEQVRFSLVALDEHGKPVICRDTEGEWMLYDAIDPGPFDPGEGTPNENYKWYRAWYGSNVVGAKLTGVSIQYADGTIACYTSEADLNRLL